MEYDEYVLKSLSKIRHKKWELFAISRIIHSFSKPINFKCQQLVRTNKGNYLTDLYFPDLKLHLEIDEHHHEPKKKIDGIRSLNIVDATKNHEIVRIGPGATDLTNPLSKQTNNLEEFIEAIDCFIQNLNSKLKDTHWNPKCLYSADNFFGKTISIKDDVFVRLQLPALRLFGYTKGTLQKGAWDIPESAYRLWFPRLFTYGEWDNNLRSDGRTISCKKLSDPKYYLEDVHDFESNSRDMIIFAKARDVLGKDLYRFIGIFRFDVEKSIKTKVSHYQRIADRIDLSQFT